MTQARHIKRMHYKKVPWKNGGGTTNEITIEPSHSLVNELTFDWRLSSAPITEEGAFSKFPDFERHLALVEGGVLHVIFQDSKKVEILRDDLVIHFRGEDEIYSKLPEGPVTDINFIYRRGTISPSVQILKFDSEKERAILFEGRSVLIFALRGEVDVSINLAEERHSLEVQDTLRVDTEDKNCLILFQPKSKDCALFAVEIRPLLSTQK